MWPLLMLSMACVDSQSEFAPPPPMNTSATAEGARPYVPATAPEISGAPYGVAPACVGCDTTRAHVASTQASSSSATTGPMGPPAAAVDGDPATAWCEGGTGTGRGEWLEVVFDAPIRLAALHIQAGDFRNAQSLSSAPRARRLGVQLAGAGNQAVLLQDPVATAPEDPDFVQVRDAPARVPLEPPASVTQLRVLFTELHPDGEGPACIAEIGFEPML